MAEYMNVWRVSRETGCTPPTVYSWINKGIKGVKLKANLEGKSMVVLRSDLEEFLRWRNEGIRVEDDRK